MYPYALLRVYYMYITYRLPVKNCTSAFLLRKTSGKKLKKRKFRIKLINNSSSNETFLKQIMETQMMGIHVEDY